MENGGTLKGHFLHHRSSVKQVRCCCMPLGTQIDLTDINLLSQPFMFSNSLDKKHF